MKGYLPCVDISEAQTLVEQFDNELGLPNGGTQTYTVPIKHQSNNQYSLLVDSQEVSLTQDQIDSIMGDIEARASGYLPPKNTWVPS